MTDTDWFLSEWQAGFRSGRSCRDNILLLGVIYDQYVCSMSEGRRTVHRLRGRLRLSVTPVPGSHPVKI